MVVILMSSSGMYKRKVWGMNNIKALHALFVRVLFKLKTQKNKNSDLTLYFNANNVSKVLKMSKGKNVARNGG